MEITVRDFILRPSLNAPTKFDLVRKITRKKQDSSEIYSSESEMGFGMTLEHTINVIISIILSDKKVVMDLKGYLEEYKKEKSDILDTIKQFTN